MEKQKEQYFIYFLRAFAVICILACHLVVESHYTVLKLSAQVLNVGVDIFFFISAFCFGIQGSVVEPLRWYKKRISRIAVPYELFLIILAFIYLIIGRSLPLKEYISCIFAVQGAQVGVLGADHTWFITSILIAYLFVPIFSKLVDSGKEKILFIICMIVPIFLSIIPIQSFFTILHEVCFFGIGYVIGRKYERGEKYTLPNIAVIVLIIFFGCIRLIARKYIDGSILYDRILVGYTQFFISLCLSGLFYNLFKSVKAPAIVRFICDISFEIYLYHYMFIVGPVSLMKVTESWIMNSCIVILVSITAAKITNIISKKLQMFFHHISSCLRAV